MRTTTFGLFLSAVLAGVLPRGAPAEAGIVSEGSGPAVAGAGGPAVAGAGGPAQPASCPAVARIRFHPRKGQAARMLKGRFTGSNTGRTTEFQTIAEIKETPPDGQWTELTVARPVKYRYVRYESPLGGWGNVGEVEFRSGDVKLKGAPFGSVGSRGSSGNDFTKALDGDVGTFFDGEEAHNQYVGIDLGEHVQAAAPQFSPRPGAYPTTQTVTIASPTPGAKIRIARNWGTPDRDHGEAHKGPIAVERSAVLIAVAYTDDLAASPVVVAPYRIGQAAGDGGDRKAVRTFHIGNSLTDTVDGWLKPVADSAGRSLDFHRFTIPGAPTDWLWNHPGGGFGDSRYPDAFFVLAPIDHIFTQPFAGHGRSVENEAEHSGRFFELCRKDSPGVQAWLYVQWPGPQFSDSWAQAKGSAAGLGLKPATTWQEGVANHMAYTEAVARLINKTYRGKPVRIVPGGQALAALKTEVDAGKVPGMTGFFRDIFADGIHLTPKGRYMISLVHYGCIFRESPEGKASGLNAGLTPDQLRIFQRLAWGEVKDCRWTGDVGSGAASPGPAEAHRP